MVNTLATHRSSELILTRRLVATYVVIALATVAALAALSAAGSGQATGDAWTHAVIVGAFAILLPLRLRAARRGRDGALRAVQIIAAVLLAANLVEAAIPGLFPAWMRIEMLGIAALMAGVSASALRTRR